VRFAEGVFVTAIAEIVFEVANDQRADLRLDERFRPMTDRLPKRWMADDVVVETVDKLIEFSALFSQSESPRNPAGSTLKRVFRMCTFTLPNVHQTINDAGSRAFKQGKSDTNALLFPPV
jgi:hypothetical protein